MEGSTYGAVVRWFRTERKLSVDQLARMAHLNSRAIRRIEADEAIPVGKDLLKLEGPLQPLRGFRHLIKIPKPHEVKPEVIEVTVPKLPLPEPEPEVSPVPSDVGFPVPESVTPMPARA